MYRLRSVWHSSNTLQAGRAFEKDEGSGMKELPPCDHDDCGLTQCKQSPSKEAIDHARDICKQLQGSLKYWRETSVFVQLAINTSTAPLEQRINELEMSLAVAGTETAAYFKGCDETLAGIAGRWKESLEEPIPKPGVMNEPLESLYRRTEQLRQRIKELEQDKKLLLSSLKQITDSHNDLNRTLSEQISTQQKALEDMTEHYVALINSGDAGNWNPEDEDVVKKARAAMGKIT
jgi:hypothetical protein